MPQKQRNAATCISEHLINIYIRALNQHIDKMEFSAYSK